MYISSVFLFLLRFMAAPPTLLPKQMQESHLCALPAVNTHTRGNWLTCANTFTLPPPSLRPLGSSYISSGGLWLLLRCQTPSGLCRPAPPALTTQRASQLPSTGVDRKQEEGQEDEKVFAPTTIQETAGEPCPTTRNHSFHFHLLRQTDTESRLCARRFSHYSLNTIKNVAEITHAVVPAPLAASAGRLQGSLLIDRRWRAQRNDGGLLTYPQTGGLLHELICFHRVCLSTCTDPLYLMLAVEC